MRRGYPRVSRIMFVLRAFGSRDASWWCGAVRCRRHRCRSSSSTSSNYINHHQWAPYSARHVKRKCKEREQWWRHCQEAFFPETETRCHTSHTWLHSKSSTNNMQNDGDHDDDLQFCCRQNARHGRTARRAGRRGHPDICLHQ